MTALSCRPVVLDPRPPAASLRRSYLSWNVLRAVSCPIVTHPNVLWIPLVLDLDLEPRLPWAFVRLDQNGNLYSDDPTSCRCRNRVAQQAGRGRRRALTLAVVRCITEPIILRALDSYRLGCHVTGWGRGARCRWCERLDRPFASLSTRLLAFGCLTQYALMWCGRSCCTFTFTPLARGRIPLI